AFSVGGERFPAPMAPGLQASGFRLQEESGAESTPQLALEPEPGAWSLEPASGEAASSLCAEAVGWAQASGVQRGEERREQADDDREAAGDAELERPHVHREARDEVDLRVEREAVGEEPLAARVAEEEAERRPHEADHPALVEEHAQDRVVARPDRLQER